MGEALRTGCLAGCESQPQENTSLARDPGADPGRLSGALSMVWVHHSTDSRLLGGGLLHALKRNNVTFFDVNYGEARVDGYVIGDHTDPPDFPRIFNTPRYLEVILGWGLEKGKKHDIVMFKSCYPASNITSEKLLARYRRWYASMLPTFAKHPRVLFIPMSTPPLVRSATSADNAARARRFARWLTSEYGRGLPNVQAFDLFDALAVREGTVHANTLVAQFAESNHDSHPNRLGAQAVTRLFIPWLNRALRRWRGSS